MQGGAPCTKQSIKYVFGRSSSLNLRMNKLTCYGVLRAVHVIDRSANPIFDTKMSTLCPQSVLLRLPLWILKRGGLESSGCRLISLNISTSIIAFFVLFLYGKFFLGGGEDGGKVVHSIFWFFLGET